MYVNIKSEITVLNGKVNVNELIMTNYNSEYNINGTFRIIDGDIQISKIELLTEIDTCIDLISFKSSYVFEKPLISTEGDITQSMLNNRKLYRICNSDNKDSKVICHMKGTSYSNSFATRCPCDQDECEYDINKQEINMERNVLNHKLIVCGDSKLTNCSSFSSISLHNNSYLELGPSLLVSQVSINEIIFNSNSYIQLINSINQIAVEKIMVDYYQKNVLFKNVESNMQLQLEINSIDYKEPLNIIDRRMRDIIINDNGLNISLQCDKQAYI